MSGTNKVRYKLSWPGLRALTVYIIDPNDVVYGPENRLPPGQRHLNTLENQYVKLYAVMALLSDQERLQGSTCLNKLITEFGLRSMKTIACFTMTPIGQQVVVDQYLPLVTLLPFTMICPSKAFRTLCCGVMSYLEMSLELPCMECGFITRNCICDKAERMDDVDVSVGYVISYMDQETQTTGSSEDLPRTGPPPLQCMEDMSKDVSKSVMKPPAKDDTTVMMGVGGIKVRIPQEYKLQPGARMPLSMVQGPDGPCLMPMDNTHTSFPYATIPQPMLPPGANRMMPPFPMMFPPIDPGINMSMLPPVLPPLPLPPLGSMLPPVPPVSSIPIMPPVSAMDSSNIPQLNFPMMSNYSQSAYDPGENPAKMGAPRGHVAVRFPKNMNPKYINSPLGTFKRMSSTRNIGLQVETVILPKKKGFMMQSKIAVKKQANNKEKKDGEVGTPVKSSPKVKKLSEYPGMIDSLSTMTFQDGQLTANGNENKPKPPAKKVDKVWRMIADDSDSDNEEGKKKEGDDLEKVGKKKKVPTATLR